MDLQVIGNCSTKPQRREIVLPDDKAAKGMLLQMGWTGKLGLGCRICKLNAPDSDLIYRQCKHLIF